MEAQAGKTKLGRVGRAGEVLRAHRTSITAAGYCRCGFLIPGWETIEDHQARMICHELYGNKAGDARHTSSRQHEGNEHNLSMHRAAGESPCGACLSFMDQVSAEGRKNRARV